MKKTAPKMQSGKHHTSIRNRCVWRALLVGVTLAPAQVGRAEEITAQAASDALSPYMNSVPPSKDFLCVSNGGADALLHPDRAPNTQLAMQDGVVLYSGTAPQLGFNFQLNAGSLVYRNQMSTLGAPEPSPQLGTAATLLQRPVLDDNLNEYFLPWSEARWHQGEDIVWEGYRASPGFLEGNAFYHYTFPGDPGSTPCSGGVGSYEALSSRFPLEGNPHKPCLQHIADHAFFSNQSSINLQLARGIYQASQLRPHIESVDGLKWDEFREPWFQGRAAKPAFNVKLDTDGDEVPDLRMSDSYYPNFLNIYAFEELDLDSERLTVKFERSATWPRDGRFGGYGEGEISGAVVAESIADDFGNRVEFDRVPDYGWETDFKIPSKPTNISTDDGAFGTGTYYESVLDSLSYAPKPQSWRLPHKRLRSVKLFDAENPTEPRWTVAFVYEHPESDRISVHDTPPYPGTAPQDNPFLNEWKSLYSHLPQTNWDFGRLPQLNDETTLLTVQVYRGDVYVNGAPFQDDYSVWGSRIDWGELTNEEKLESIKRVNKKAEYRGDFNGDGCPGICGIDDDGDGLIDEDCLGRQPWDSDYQDGCASNWYDDDNEDCDTQFPNCIEWQDENGEWHGETADVTVLTGTDGTRDMNSDGCPGRCGIDEDGDGLNDETSDGMVHQRSAVEPLYYYDDDEDGLIDEDSDQDPLLVNIRMAEGACASGMYPFLPRTSPDGWGGKQYAVMPGDRVGALCRPVDQASNDPWVYQIQYVYARSNPFWLLSGRQGYSNPDQTDANYGKVAYRDQPAYYYFPPFDPDLNGDGVDDIIYQEWTTNGFTNIKYEHDLPRAQDGPFKGLVVDSSNDPENKPENTPNVHPDCLPNPNFRGPQGRRFNADDGVYERVTPIPPSDIHLIKRIVRIRTDDDDPHRYIEQTYLYRYNDIGFLKAVFDPQAVQAVIDADPDDAIDDPDDILRYADTEPIGETGHQKPLISFASEWYTYYNSYEPYFDSQGEIVGIPACYDEALPDYENLIYCDTNSLGGPLDLASPFSHKPLNVCDGRPLWSDKYGDELHIDPDCSSFMPQKCGWCYFRDACNSPGCSNIDQCTCAGSSYDETALLQMGIPGAKPRARRYMIKTARTRGSDGEFHTYRFDYLGAASSVYDDNTITSYADAHNIAIVDELVEQSSCEFDQGGTDACDRNEFYVYEDEFRFDLDPMDSNDRPTGGTYDGAADYIATSHFLFDPMKVKTRRVVTMNYYGIAISDRLILTPGFQGTQASLVDNQQYELLNTRGQAVHVYDPSWVAVLRNSGEGWLNEVKTKGRVLTELFGGEGGWFSVLKGIAWGSNGGNAYDQQCKTPEVLEDVPVQQVAAADLNVLQATKHFGRSTTTEASDACAVDPGDADGPGCVRDMPSIEAVFYKREPYTSFTGIIDPAHTIDTGSGGDGCEETNGLASGEIDLGNQEPVRVESLPVETEAEDDGVSLVKYYYEFHGSPQTAVKWKYRWQESVSPDHGGSGRMALEIWYIDDRGRIRFHGQGSGAEQAGNEYPVPKEPFIVSYFGYDEYGRQSLQVRDVWPNSLPSAPGDSVEFPKDLHDELGDIESRLKPDDSPHTPLEYITRLQYNNAGMLTSRLEGFDELGTADYVPRPAEDVDGNGTLAANEYNGNAIRTDYDLIANRSITYEADDSSGGGTHIETAWSDPNIYQIEYSSVVADGAASSGFADVVYGTTNVTIMNRSGKPFEHRVLAWDPSWKQQNGKITDQDLWGVSLTDFTYNGAINSSTKGLAWIGGAAQGAVDAGLWDCEPTGDPWNDPNCFDEEGEPKLRTPTPAFPGNDAWIGNAPAGQKNLVTLARTFALYDQASTLKPTHEIVTRKFDDPPTADFESDPNLVIREFEYDLEDRIARQVEPDGTRRRLLFDSRRRPTKVFQGSNDSCHDWFPLGDSGDGTTDDMVLTQQYLYNDAYLGDAGWDCEHSPLPGVSGCTTIPFDDADQKYKSAAKLVRTRKFTGMAETCDGAFHSEASSRDTRLLYDKRGRAVIQEEVAIGYGKVGGTTSDATNPKYVSVTSTVYNNIDQPLIVATWPEGANLTVEEVEGWADSWDPASPELLVATIHNRSPQPLSLSMTLYDERGRAYEQRTYRVDPIANPPQTHADLAFTYSRTYRDDLDRVVGELGPGGMTFSEYDSLGRVTRTSRYSQETDDDPSTHEGVELTRTVYTYDAFGNVLTQVHHDRKNLDDVASGAELNCETGNAICTYTCNWYDKAKRLVATAYYGTNSDNYFTYAAAPSCSQESPPVWGNQGSQSGSYSYEINGVSLNDVALVSQYGYDAAGRRIWTRDGNGVVTRTWYDMLGRALLEAENWRDPDGNAGPDGSDLTPNHSDPIRYTAYHYTRGGLLDVRMAILPADPDMNIVPTDIHWDDDAGPDFAAGENITFGTANDKIQATRYVYGTDLSGNTIQNVVPEITIKRAELNDTVASFPNLVGEIHYPDATSGLPGAADSDTVKIKYTISGQIAERTDQRGVKLRYEYGTDTASPGGTQLSAVRADLSGASGVDDFVTHREFVHDARGLLTGAWSLGGVGGVTIRNRITMSYDGYQNLVSAMLLPTPPIFKYGKTTYYEWCEPDGSGGCVAVNGNRLSKITYPSGLEFELDYGASGTASDATDRAIGIVRDTGTTFTNLVRYKYTGGGQTIGRTNGIGNGAIVRDFENTPSGTPPGLDRFGRITNLSYVDNGTSDTLQSYYYGYDNNGNRTYARITQANHDNDRSFAYQYDQLNRLVNAEYGTLVEPLSSTSPAFDRTTLDSQGWGFRMDVLGNFADSDPNEWGIERFTTGSLGTPTVLDQVNHSVSADNSINEIETAGQSPVALVHDAAGSLTADPTADAVDYGAALPGQQYVYDAWNRPVLVKDGDGNDVARYEIDPLGRRSRKIVYQPSTLATLSPHELFYYDGSRVIEWYRGVEESVLVCDGGGDPGGGGGAQKARDDSTSDASTKVTHSTSAQLASSTDIFADNPKLARMASETGGGLDHTGTSDPGDPGPNCHYESQASVEATRRFVWGLDYIDEKIAHYDITDDHDFILQDANYNVVGVVSKSGTPRYQFAYGPYGEIIASEYIPYFGDIDVHASSEFPETQFFAGAWLDKETGLVWMRNRLYSPILKRFISQDPNGQALVLMDVLARNAQTMEAFSKFDMSRQYIDGMNLYAYAHSNPVMHGDPSGRVVFEFVVAGLVGAGFNALYKSLELTLSGQAAYQDWWDSMKEVVTAAGKGGIAGMLFMGAAYGGGAGLNYAFGGGVGAWASALGGTAMVGMGLYGSVKANERSQYALDTMDEFEMEMSFVDHAFAGVMTLGGAMGLTRGVRFLAGGHAEIAGNIAEGHAWTKHAADWQELNIRSPSELAAYLERVMMSYGKALSRGRWAWWDSKTGVVVIHDPNNVDMGTAFRPSEGKAYYDNTLK